MLITIAVGSSNLAKLMAVRQAIRSLWPSAHLASVPVDSGVGDMPLTDEAGQRGAMQRARQARAVIDADLGIGLEGSVADSVQGMFLTGWVAVVARDGRLGLASSARILLPECIARQVRAGTELGPLIDHYSGSNESKQHLGAVGFLTGGRVKRAEAFRTAVLFALAPFMRPDLYDTEK